MGFLFISYSHKDQEYVYKLKGALVKEGFDVWIDERIDYGSEWPKVIQDYVDRCIAFILVMSVDSYNSAWVQNELARAIAKNKPVFPLLLKGDIWLPVQTKQIEDVRDWSLPRKKFFQDLSKILDEHADTAHDLSPLPADFKGRETASQPEPASSIDKQLQPNSESRSTKILLIDWFGKLKNIKRHPTRSHDDTIRIDKEPEKPGSKHKTKRIIQILIPVACFGIFLVIFAIFKTGMAEGVIGFLRRQTETPALTTMVMSTNTATKIPALTQTPAETTKPHPSSTPIPPRLPTITSKPLPSSTPLPLPTNTHRPPTSTSKPLQTDTPLPPATNTPLPPATNTPIAITASPTSGSPSTDTPIIRPATFTP